jgi:acetyl/propionyl-CoA carboxylase alpha subunit
MRMRKLLVANRGEIARRVFRTCREMGIATVAVFSDADRAAPFVAEADEAVALGGATAAESYLRVDAILDAARRTGADAVHPGYGFLAENAAFAQRCAEAGLVFVGPPADAIAAMGSKIAARGRMHAAGVPVLPGAAVADVAPAALRALADQVGWPILVKASAGGGGKGMRIVRTPEALEEAVASAAREAHASFGDGTLLLERYLDAPRHVEVQVFGDGHGNVAALFERECSIQRRHQKIVEECPSPAVDELLRSALCAAAVAAARSVNYVGAGTVEFLLAADRSFYFLEMNTRLQVEHPVTECVTGLDLVRLQLLVAQGDPLPARALHPSRSGHAIEARLYAEDPLRDFLPVTGTIHRFEIGAAPGLRVDSGVADGSVVGLHYDPLLAKVIAHAPTRGEAAARLAAALAGMRLHGLVTNRDLLVRVLRHPEFLSGATDTHFLERHDPATLGAPLADAAAERVHAVAAALAAVAERRSAAAVLGFAPPGWRNNPSQPQESAFEGRGGQLRVGYRFERSGLAVSVDGVALAVRLGDWSPARVEIEIEGIRRVCHVQRVGDVSYVDSALGHSALRGVDRFPPPAAEAVPEGTLVAPMPGVVVRIDARLGDEVAQGAVVAVLEAMKMEHRVTAPHGGRVAELRVREGQAVEAGVVLAVIANEGPAVG